jgi:hypothetical protein
MIADLDETIRQLLIAELPIRNGEIDVRFDQPRREVSARWTKPTVDLFLYDLRENAVLRRHQWDPVRDGNGGDNHQRRKRSPFRVDCCYMLTAWVGEHPEDEHRLLTCCMLALFRFPVLPGERLVGSLQDPPYPIQARLASHDKLTNPAEVWSALDNEVRPSISYSVTLALDPWAEVSGPIVRTATVRTGQATALPHERRLVEGTREERTTVGGSVRDAAREGAPTAGVPVAVQGTGLASTTDERGRYALGSLPQGQYTLVAQPPEGRPVEKQVAVPAVDAGGRPVADGDYDLEI